ncbi:Protein-arginine kinase activator protein [bioreactor metagenome]|uniref:Protein-arginine kinase activator protein n=1 Tax=bioreactor metagenome TaxID=1076179 RepID=A0A645E284_9ZZZZ
MPVGISNTERCPMCGASFQEIVKSGKIGCAECYDKFYDLLLPSVQRIHGKTAHSGKIAANNEIEIKKENVLEELKAKLAQAIEEQNFEYAAELRDKIKEMESGDDHHE